VERLIGFWNPDSDPSGATYNITQSITAVGSGGLDGRGVAGATQTNMNYLPEHSTDFIFSSLAEQRGFLGAALLLLLYAIVVWRGVRTIAIAPSLYTATIAAGVVVAFVFQVFVNIGMTIGMAPITGIPLPFVSYGGSSMIATLAMIGLLQAVHVRGRLAAGR
jgi:rod shape determining protein RodA